MRVLFLALFSSLVATSHREPEGMADDEEALRRLTPLEWGWVGFELGFMLDQRYQTIVSPMGVVGSRREWLVGYIGFALSFGLRLACIVRARASPADEWDDAYSRPQAYYRRYQAMLSPTPTPTPTPNPQTLTPPPHPQTLAPPPHPQTLRLTPPPLTRAHAHGR